MQTLEPILTRSIRSIKKLISPLRNRKGKKRWIERDGVRFFKALGVRPGDSILDFGCNWGSYTLPAAAAIGTMGTIVAIDQNKHALRRLQAKAARLGLQNIHTGTDLNDAMQRAGTNQFDLVLLYDMLHFLPADNRTALYARLRQLLKPKRILSVHCSHLKDDRHPARHFADCTLNDIVHEVESAGFHLKEKKVLPLWHSYDQVLGRVLEFIKDTNTA